MQKPKGMSKNEVLLFSKQEEPVLEKEISQSELVA